MSAHPRRRRVSTLFRVGFCLLASPFLARSVQAASSTWTGATDGNFFTANNWTLGVPGTVSTSLTTAPASSTDVATFATSSNTSVSIAGTANVGIGLISFDGTNTSGSISAFTFGNGATTSTAPTFYSGGVQVGSSSSGRDVINILATVTTATATAETFNTPIFLTQSAGFGNDATSANVTLNIAGNVTTSVTSATNINLRLNGTNTGNNTISGLIADNGSAVVSILKGAVGGLTGGSGTGTWVLSNNNNSFTGGVALQAGTLSVATIGNSGSASALGTNSSINFGANAGTTGGSVAGGVLLYTGTGETSNKVVNLNTTAGGNRGTLDQSGTGSLVLSGGITALGAASAPTQTITLQGSTIGTGTISGAITNPTAGGTLGVIKAGTGTWTLSGANNAYTGATTINGGMLTVTSSITTSSGVAVNSGGILSGTGSVPAITLASGGTVTPGTVGTATGALTGASMSFASGGTLTFALSNTNNTSNLLTLTGAFTKTGSQTTGYNFNISGGVVGQTYGLVNYGSTTFASTSVFTDTGSTLGTFSLATPNELTFTVTAVPEPSTWMCAAMMLGIAGMAVYRRSKSRALTA